MYHQKGPSLRHRRSSWSTMQAARFKMRLDAEQKSLLIGLFEFEPSPVSNSLELCVFHHVKLPFIRRSPNRSAQQHSSLSTRLSCCPKLRHMSCQHQSRKRGRIPVVVAATTALVISTASLLVASGESFSATSLVAAGGRLSLKDRHHHRHHHVSSRSDNPGRTESVAFAWSGSFVGGGELSRLPVTTSSCRWDRATEVGRHASARINMMASGGKAKNGAGSTKRKPPSLPQVCAWSGTIRHGCLWRWCGVAEASAHAWERGIQAHATVTKRHLPAGRFNLFQNMRSVFSKAAPRPPDGRHQRAGSRRWVLGLLDKCARLCSSR